MSKGAYKTASGEHPYYVDDRGEPVHKDAWDDDFRAGWAAAGKQRNVAAVTDADAQRAFHRAKGKHGSTFLEGFHARVHHARGVRHKGVFYAEALGLLPDGRAAVPDDGEWHELERGVFTKAHKGYYAIVERYRGGSGWVATIHDGKQPDDIGVFETERGAKVAGTRALAQAHRGPGAAALDREHRRQERYVQGRR